MGCCELINPPAHLNTSYRHFFLFVHEVRSGNDLLRDLS